MKKLFSLVMFALLAVGVNAQTWKATDVSTEKLAAETTIIGNDQVTISTVYSSKNSGYSLSKDYTISSSSFQIRVTAAPSTSELAGTEYSDATSLIVQANQDANVSFYFRRQKGSAGYDNDDNKDMRCFAQNEKDYSSEEELLEEVDASKGYANVKKTYKFAKDGIYTVYATGTTLSLFCIDVSEPVTDPAAAPTFDPKGGDIQAFSKITLTSDGTVYYQWQDAETTLTKDSEGWTAGSSVEVPNVTGTKYLYAYATNGDGLESDIVSQVYNISEVTLTAETNKTWDFSKWETKEITSMFYNDNLIINAASGSAVNIKNSRIELGGGGKKDSRNITFMVAPKSRVGVTCIANSERVLNVDLNEFGETIGNIPAPTSSTTTYIDYTGNEDATLIIYSTNGGINVSKITVEPLPTETKEVTEAGWATYIPTSNALFEDGDAYVVTAVNAANVEIEGVTAVPAGTPVLLKGEDKKTITLTTATIEAPEKNLLEVYDGEQEGKVAYVLAKDEVNGAGFKKWTGETSVLTDRAVLWLGETQAARGFFALDGEATGIENVATAVAQEGAVYDLQGRRVAQPKAGLYIVNGKKVVVK